MSHTSRRRPSASLFALLVAALCVASAGARAAQSGEDKSKEEQPPYSEYKGVKIGMPADEARKKLGSPADKGDKQDFYVFGENETAQLFYDESKKVYAISVVYMNGANGAPSPKAVLGKEVAAKQDGSMHEKLDFPKAGFWVAYSRTGGDSPLVTVTLQKKQ